MLRPIFAATILIASSTAGASALAQTAPPTPAPTATDRRITPPAVQGGTDVPYPAGAQGDATVLLDVEIDKEGRVSRAEVKEGAEPFAEQARQAVLEWRFTPARRGNTPVGARIRATVAFHQELPPTQAASSAGSAMDHGPTAAPAASKVVLEIPEEVTVHGTRREIGETRLSAADIREMPGAFGDPFRAIEALPGVIPLVSGLPFFYIRGAPPTNNAYLVDGIRVPLLFHVGIGEGVIHPALIDHVDFYPGAAPAAYGGAAGAVIAGQTRDPATTPHGEVNLRLIDAGALLESPFDGERGTALVAGRYGYPGPILDAITSTVRLGYWDYQARATFRVSDRDTLGIFGFGSHDYLGTASTNNGQVGPIVKLLGSDFHRIDLRYDRAIRGGHVRVATTLGYDSMGGTDRGDGNQPVDRAAPGTAGSGGGEPNMTPAATPPLTTVTNLSLAGRLDVDETLSPAVRLRGGADAEFDHYRFDQSQSSEPLVPSSADPPPDNFRGGVHADVTWRVTPRVEIVPGFRVDLFESARANGPAGALESTIVPAFDPRLSARVTIAPWLAWASSLGLSHQFPVLRVGTIPAFLVSVPGFPTGDSELQTAAQASQGLEFALPADFTLTTTGFLSGWSGLTDLTSSCIQIMPATTPPQSGNNPPPAVPWTCPSNDPVHGVAYGLEVLLRRPLSKRLSGWLSYTLSRSTRQEHFITPSGGDAQATVVSDYDRTHMLNAIVAYDLGRGWRAGGRFVFFTGAPYSILQGNVPVPPYNDQREPPFYRVDVRLEKRWHLARSGFIALIAEVQNLTLSKETTALGYSCQGSESSRGGTTQCRLSTIGPLTLPSIGAEASF